MKIMAKITAAIFLFLGALLVLGGLGMALTAWAKGAAMPLNPSPFFGNTTAWMRWVRVLAAGMVAFQGLLLGALGQALWLLADIAAGVASRA